MNMLRLVAGPIKVNEIRVKLNLIINFFVAKFF